VSIVSELNKRALLRDPDLKACLYGRLKRGPIDSPCWIWKGPRSKEGYGSIYFKGQWLVGVHRLAYQVYNEVVLKPSEVVRHLCNEKLCLNPDHLAVGTHRENAYDREISR
jgi:hypothetical protein